MNMNEGVKLELKIFGNISGVFSVPSYQRGYRWGSNEVHKLLTDISGIKDNPSYCLQPIVIKPAGKELCSTIDGREIEMPRYELIDGQQRLTTLFLTFCHIRNVYKPRIKIDFLLDYQTRTCSREYLKNPIKADSQKYIDYYYIYQAYNTISKYFEEQSNPDLAADKIYQYLCEKVSIIWYEVDASNSVSDNEISNESNHYNRNHSIDLFTRLNIGKIALNNAELIKALFLSRDNCLPLEKRIEIATSWDIIEHDLHTPEFWAFLTNQSPDNYAARIELLFDMIANKSPNERNDFFTFEHFMSQIKKDSGSHTKNSALTIVGVWDKVQKCYFRLKGWYNNRNFFHKIGFLVASGFDLKKLLSKSETLTKKDFEDLLNQEIKHSINLSPDEFLSLTYRSLTDHYIMGKLLLLFNVETVRLLKNSNEKYSFSAHKDIDGWSLEHIHAQESQGLNTEKEWIEWLQDHRKSLLELPYNHDEQSRASILNENRNELISRIDTAMQSISRPLFLELFTDIIKMLSENGETDYLHSMANMALLSKGTNAAFNNSTFAVKRMKMLDKDKNGDYIPICTRRVFLKYYTNKVNQQLCFWSKDDREAYIKAFVGSEDCPGLISPYLNENNQR